MLHLLNIKNQQYLLIALMCSLAMSTIYGWQTVSLSSAVDDKNIPLGSASEQVMRGPFHVLYEHALADFQHYYLNSLCDSDCCQQLFDISIDPVCEYESVNSSNRSILNYGAFVKAQFNWNRFWFRAYDLIGQVEERPHDGNRKSAGADDVVLKIGYDFIVDSEKHLGLYALASIPTRFGLNAEAIGTRSMYVDLLVKSPSMGSKNVAIGCGLNGAYSLYDCDSTRMAFLFDAQYAYLIPAKYASLSMISVARENEVNLVPSYASSEDDESVIAANVKYTPGHSIINWLAFNATFDSNSIEFGSELRFDFGSKASLCLKQDLPSYKERVVWMTPSLSCNIKPYVAWAHTFYLKANPLLLGLGLAYDYNELRKIQYNNNSEKLNVFQGFNVWATASFNF